MNTKEYKKYRRVYEHHCGPIPIDDEGRSYDIHHIDGDRTNNDINNLIALSLYEHYDIHYWQGDWKACHALMTRMKIPPEEISRMATLANYQKVEDGTHPFVGGAVQRKRVADGTHNLLGDSNPVHRLIADGTHNFLGDSNPVHKLMAEGTHKFLGDDNPANERWVCDDCGTIGFGSGNYVRYHEHGKCQNTGIDWTCDSCGVSGRNKTNFIRWHKDGKCMNKLRNR